MYTEEIALSFQQLTIFVVDLDYFEIYHILMTFLNGMYNFIGITWNVSYAI